MGVFQGSSDLDYRYLSTVLSMAIFSLIFFKNEVLLVRQVCVRVDVRAITSSH